MFDKIYIRALCGITGITATMLYGIHTGQMETNVSLAGIAGICACVALDRVKVVSE